MQSLVFTIRAAECGHNGAFLGKGTHFHGMDHGSACAVVCFHNSTKEVVAW